jgi:hypothetical protein
LPFQEYYFNFENYFLSIDQYLDIANFSSIWFDCMGKRKKNQDLEMQARDSKATEPDW